MKAVGAIIVAGLFAAPALADPSAAPSAATRSDFTLAPSSATSPAALMARAFRPRPESCTDRSPGTLPLLAPAPVNQASCLLSPYTNDQWARCPAFPAAPVLSLPAGVGTVPPPRQQPSYLVGDQLSGTEQGVSLLTGHVQLDQGDRRITSDRMSYDSNSGIARAASGINYVSPAMMLTSASGQYDTGTGTGSFKNAVFLLPQRHGHGQAGVFNSLDDDHSQLYQVSYTTCPAGQQDWSLTAPDLFLDTSTNTGIAHDATIRFYGVPIFWSPYLNFPISSDRKSGFLGANFSFDVINGFEMAAPYYLNLADNYDVTLFPRIITKRGVQAGVESRWLTPINSGYIYGDYLPHDRLASRERSQFIFRNVSNFDQFNRLDENYNWISDDNYFRDLGSDLTVNSATTLERHIAYTYDDEADWLFKSQFQDFQTIDPLIPPQNFTYRRVPQLLLYWGNNEDFTGPEFNLSAEAVRFQRELRIGTWRSDIMPSMGLPLGGAGGFFTPSFAWRLTDYDLNADSFTPYNQPEVLVPERHLARSLPIFDIDTGLYFESDGEDYTQSLEPRLYYLRVPYRDQSQIPIFDSVQPEFGYPLLFSTNRFYGADRQGDANQLSYALTHRVLDASTGAQIFEADIGQIRYFADRRVQINNGPPDTSLFSDVIGDMTYNLNELWTASYSQDWDPVARETDLATAMLQYHPGYHQVMTVGFMYRRAANPGNDLKQTSVSYAWPLTNSWSWIGGWNYDEARHQTVEEIVGFEYDTCCWNFQIANRRYRQTDNRYDSVFLFTFQLKGLGFVGRHLEELLQRDILGYSNGQFDESLQPQGQPTPQ